MNKINITAAKYAPNHPITSEVSQSVFATIDGVECHIPVDPANLDYAEIKRQVEAGTLTIEPADE